MRKWSPASAASFRSTAPERSKSAESASMSAEKTPQSARYAGWRIAQREGFKKLWAQSHNLPVSRRRRWPTRRWTISSLDHRRARADRAELATLPSSESCSTAPVPASCSEFRASAERTQPMLLIPVTIDRRNGDKRRASQSLAAGMGAVPDIPEPDRLCPGKRAWHRSAAHQCGPDGASRTRLVAQYPRHLRRRRHPCCGGEYSPPLSRRPGSARFIGRHGPDGEIIGGFDLTAPNSAALPR
jgi:hypothetical protein